MKKIKIRLEEIDWRIVFNALNDLRTKAINEGRYTDAVDDIMIRVAKAAKIS